MPRLATLTLGVPHVNARAAALFRILAGGLFVLLFFTNSGLANSDGVVTGGGIGIGSWDVIRWIKARPDLHQSIYGIAAAAAIAFTLGAWTRLSAIVLWISLFLLIGAGLVLSGHHNWSVPLIATSGLMFAPLADAWSLDAIRRRDPVHRAPELYGLMLWWVGFVFGVAYLAAAISKLWESGIAWVTTGAIRFHFVQDIGQAAVPWGLWIAGRTWLSILLSALAMLVEATFILVIFTRRDRWRAVAGIAGVSLHLGFYLFQGMLWLPWFVLYTAFLPWEAIAARLGTGGADAAAGVTPRFLWHHAPAFAAAAVYVLTAQMYATTSRVEYEPLLSSMPMYANTFASWDEFFAYHRWTKYQTYAFRIEGVRDGDKAVDDALDRYADTIVAVVRARCSDDEPSENNRERLQTLARELTDHLGRTIETLDVQIAQRTDIDLEAGAVTRRRVDEYLASLRLSTATLSKASPDFARCAVAP